MMITKETLDAALSGQTGAMLEIAKTDLHAHLLLSAPLRVVQELSGHRIPNPPARFRDLGDFLDHIKEFYFPNFKSIEMYKGIARSCFEHMLADGIVYCEVSFDLAMPLLLNMTWPEMVEALRPEIDRMHGRLAICPELGVARDFQHPERQRLILDALDTGLFESVDLYGAETLRPAEDFMDYLKEARRRGLKIKMHSGETSPPERIMREVSLVEPDGIQHGVRASEDPRVLALFAEMGVEVNVCPHSNWCLRVVDDYSRHPIRQMFDAGVRVTVNSDDYTIFGRSVGDEYVELYRAGIFSADELEQIRLNGLSAYESWKDI